MSSVVASTVSSSILVNNLTSSTAKKFNGSTMAITNLPSFLSMAINLYFLTIDSGISVTTPTFTSYLAKSTLGKPNWYSRDSTISSDVTHFRSTKISPIFLLEISCSLKASDN